MIWSMDDGYGVLPIAGNVLIERLSEYGWVGEYAGVSGYTKDAE